MIDGAVPANPSDPTTELQVEARYRSLFEGMSEGFALHEIVCDEQGMPVDWRFLEVNPAFEKLTGLKRGDVVGRLMTDVLPQEDRRLVKICGEVALTGHPIHFENYAPSLKRHYEVFAYRPAPRQFAAIFMDITERRKAEEEIRRNKELLELAAEAAGLGVFAWDPRNDQILWENDRMREIIGRSPTEPLFSKARFARESVHPEDAQKFERELAGALNIGKTAGIQCRIRRQNDGALRWIEFSGSFSSAKGDGSPLVIAAARDITERKRREKELGKLNRTLRAFSHSDQAMLRVSDESEYLKEICKIIIEDCGHALVWIGFAENDAAKSVRPVAFSGLEEGYLETLHVTWADSERGRGPTGTAIRTGRPSMCRNMLTDPLFEPWRREALARGYASSVVLPLRDGGNAFGAITIYSREPEGFSSEEIELLSGLADECAYGLAAIRLRVAHARAEAERQELLSREREARKEAEAANRAKDDFLAVLSHELRTPLTSVLGWTKIIQSGRLDSAGTARGLEVIEQNVKSQARLIEDLLDVSRIVAGKLKIEKTIVDLSSITQAAVETLRMAALEKQVGLECSLAASSVPFEGDAARLQQAVWNLVSNAIKFTPPGGRIGVVLRTEGRRAVLTVADTGVGINPAFLPRIFDRFTQEDASTTRKYTGLGLGLAIVRSIVQLHDGTVRAESDGQDKGSIFTVTLPLTVVTRPVAPPRAIGVASSGATPLVNVRVLFVEDDDDVRELIGEMLRMAGAACELARSSSEALAAFERGRPEVLVSDIGLPGEDGYTLLGKIRALERETGAERVPAIALTGYAKIDDEERVREAGYHMHLAKPVEPDVLIASVAGIARKRS